MLPPALSLRSLLNALCNLEVKEPYTEALLELGYNLQTLIEQVRCHAPSFPLSPSLSLSLSLSGPSRAHNTLVPEPSCNKWFDEDHATVGPSRAHNTRAQERDVALGNGGLGGMRSRICPQISS